MIRLLLALLLAGTVSANAQTFGPAPGASTLSANTWAATQTFTLAPVFTAQSGTRTALGLGTSATVNTGTSGATIPLLNGTNTWGAAQTISVAGAANFYANTTADASQATIQFNNANASRYGGVLYSGSSSIAFAGLFATVAGSYSADIFKYTNSSFEVQQAFSITPGKVPNSATTSAFCFNTVTGAASYNGTVGTCTVSDERLKDVLGPVTSSLEKLLRIRGVYYNWKDPAYGTGRQIGVIAQEVEAVFPELVSVDSNGWKSADYQKLVAPIINALGELKADNDNLLARLDRLEQR